MRRAAAWLLFLIVLAGAARGQESRAESQPDPAALLLAELDARIYSAEREGMTAVIKHGPTLEVLASNQLDEAIDASPAIVGNDIIIRGENHLYRIAEE